MPDIEDYTKQLEEEQKNFKALQEAYQMVFCRNPYGDIVLMDMLNTLGFFATDPQIIRPELTAFANQLLMKMGVYDGGKGLQRYIDGIIKTAKGEK